ncbi:hypothetical protein yrohd0001_1600 [Yersinia rohdei ATCC 43380]|nr:hypothetical protein yrohd0001_1600 [Yersinia rohdei ATCC 43380]
MCIIGHASLNSKTTRANRWFLVQPSFNEYQNYFLLVKKWLRMLFISLILFISRYLP